MASGIGTATLDFGAFPGSNEAEVVIPGVEAGAGVEAYIMAESSSDHTANDHKYAAMLIGLSCGEDGTVYGRCAEKLQGTFTVRYVWST